MSNHVEVLRHMKNTVLASPSERKALDAAIAALSAPQPPSGWEVVYQAKDETLGAWFDVEKARWDNYDSHLRRAVYTAPPSAPVGVEGVGYEKARELLAAAYSDAGCFSVADRLLRTAYVRDAKEVVALRAIEMALAQQPAAKVYVDFPQVGTAGPLAVVDGRVTLPDATMNDLIRHARTGYVEQPAAVDEAARLTERQAVIVTGYTGVLCCKFDVFRADLERRAGRPVFTHEMADSNWIKLLYVDDFLAITAQPGGDNDR